MHLFFRSCSPRSYARKFLARRTNCFACHVSGGTLAVTEHPRSEPVITADHIFVEWMHSEPESRGYPSAFSDLAAVMTFDHQSHAINLLTRLN